MTRRRDSRARRAPWDRGYTLIEIAAVGALVMIMFLAGVATLRSVRKADLSTSANKLSASIRYLYDLSVLNNRSYRLVIDLTGGAYWAERIDPASAACGGGLLPSEEERRWGTRSHPLPGAGNAPTVIGGGTGTATGMNGMTGMPGMTGFPMAGGMMGMPMGNAMGTPGASTANAQRGGSVLGGLGAGTAATPDTPSPSVTAPAKDNLLTRRALPKGLVFEKVMTIHQDEPTEEGKAEIYFFPDGYVERAFIYLKRDDAVYTIETIPLKGIGLVHSEALDLRDLLDRT